MPEEAGAVAVTATTEAYYDSDEADSFYAEIWGGEDIHIGVYQAAGRGRRNCERTYGGDGRCPGRLPEAGASSARLGCGVRRCWSLPGHAVRLPGRLPQPERCPERAQSHRSRSRPGCPTSCTSCTRTSSRSRDPMLGTTSSGPRTRSSTAVPVSVFSPKSRASSKPGGHFVFTDPMQTDDCPPDVLQPVLDRIHLDSLASPGFYRKNLVGPRLRRSRVRRDDEPAAQPLRPRATGTRSPT